MFKHKIRDLRNSKNLTQEELAKKIHISRQSISKWENGLSYPTKENLNSICEIFNVKISELLSEEEMVEILKYYIENIDQIEERSLFTDRKYIEDINVGSKAEKLVKEYVQLSTEIEKLQCKADEMVEQIKEEIKAQLKFQEVFLSEKIAENNNCHNMFNYIAETYASIEEIRKHLVIPNPDNEIGYSVLNIIEIEEIMYIKNNQLVSIKSVDELSNLTHEFIFVKKIDNNREEKSSKIYVSITENIKEDGTVAALILNDSGKKMFKTDKQYI